MSFFHVLNKLDHIMSTLADLQSAITSIKAETAKAVTKITDLEARIAALAPPDLSPEVTDVNAAAASLAAVNSPDSAPAPVPTS